MTSPFPHPSDVLAAEAAHGQPQPPAWTPEPVTEPVPVQPDVDSDSEPEPDLSDAPSLWPLMRLPFKRRAQFMRQFDAVSPLLDGLRAAQQRSADGAAHFDAAGAADLYDLLDGIDVMLRGAAVDTDAYDAWPGRMDENRLLALFKRYMEGSQAGNSASSTSS